MALFLLFLFLPCLPISTKEISQKAQNRNSPFSNLITNTNINTPLTHFPTHQAQLIHCFDYMPNCHTSSSSSSSSSSNSWLGGGGGGGGGGGMLLSTPFVLIFCLLFSLPILFFLLAPKPLPVPISPSDELDDLSLFHRASSSSSSSAHISSPHPKLKIAFLFLTNSDLHFAPLWDKFFKSAPPNLYNIYVHADPTLNISRPASGVFKARFMYGAKPTFRASPTLISAMRRLLATAVLDDPANAFFALLSQYCIPLHSFKYVYNALVESTSFDLSSSTTTAYGVRIQYKSFIEIIDKEPQLWRRYIARGRYAMMPEVPFGKFRVGSQFFVLTRRHALMVIKDRRLWKKFKLPCYRADECYPEEHYFPTLLSMADPNGCTHYTLTRVNWTGTIDGHPYTYRPNEISPDLIRELRKSNYSSSYLFARKFSPACLRPLLKIADKVIFRD